MSEDGKTKYNRRRLLADAERKSFAQAWRLRQLLP